MASINIKIEQTEEANLQYISAKALKLVAKIKPEDKYLAEETKDMAKQTVLGRRRRDEFDDDNNDDNDDNDKPKCKLKRIKLIHNDFLTSKRTEAIIGFRPRSTLKRIKLILNDPVTGETTETVVGRRPQSKLERIKLSLNNPETGKRTETVIGRR